jgi:hypothetical protein
LFDWTLGKFANRVGWCFRIRNTARPYLQISGLTSTVNRSAMLCVFFDVGHFEFPAILFSDSGLAIFRVVLGKFIVTCWRCFRARNTARPYLPISGLTSTVNRSAMLCVFFDVGHFEFPTILFEVPKEYSTMQWQAGAKFHTCVLLYCAALECC